MARTDWIPSREQDFADFAARWISFIQADANIAAYKWDKGQKARAFWLGVFAIGKNS